jgi:hypothetical protein
MYVSLISLSYGANENSESVYMIQLYDAMRIGPLPFEPYLEPSHSLCIRYVSRGLIKDFNSSLLR